MTAPSIKEALELLPCPLCGSKFLMGREPHDNHPVEGKFYLFHDCSPLGSPAEKCPIDVRGHFNTAEEAAAIWNTRATFQPDGERREAIAQSIRNYCRSVSPASIQVSHGVERIYYSGLSIPDLVEAIASGLVQDESGIRDGYILAPIEPTPEMLDAGEETFVSGYSGTPISTPSSVWKAMISAIRSARDGGEA